MIIEKERKFVVPELCVYALLDSIWVPPTRQLNLLYVEQTYLNPLFFGHQFDEVRVRRTWPTGGSMLSPFDNNTYYRTMKNNTPQADEREELDYEIDETEYKKYLTLRDRTLQTIVKRRLKRNVEVKLLSGKVEGVVLTLDFFDPLGPADGLILLEAEGSSCDLFDPQTMPFPTIEVTGDKRYTNREIAGGSLLDGRKWTSADVRAADAISPALMKRVNQLGNET
jgi:CYTH domain-containing protein